MSLRGSLKGGVRFHVASFPQLCRVTRTESIERRRIPRRDECGPAAAADGGRLRELSRTFSFASLRFPSAATGAGLAACHHSNASCWASDRTQRQRRATRHVLSVLFRKSPTRSVSQTALFRPVASRFRAGGGHTSSFGRLLTKQILRFNIP